MQLKASVIIDRPAQDVWDAVSNIPNSANIISGIESLEVLEQPDSGLVGLKWKETRKMFGKEATETMWVTEASEPSFYKVRAENHGSIYETVIQLKEAENKTQLEWVFDVTPETTGAKIMGFLMGRLMKKATQKMLLKDLEDIKSSLQ